MNGANRLRRAISLLREHNSQQIQNFLREKIAEYEGFCETYLKYNPLRLILFITLKCDLRCRWCGLWETEQSKPTSNSKIMEFDLFQKVIDRFRDSMWVELTGGEPFLHSSLFEMIDYAAKRRMKVVIPTNGTHIKDNIERIVRSHIAVLNISLNVIQENELEKCNRNLAELSNKILENISQLVEKRNSYRSNLKLTLSYICTKDNYKNIPRIAKLADDFKVDGLNFFNLMPFTLTKDKCLYEEDDEVVEVIRLVPQPKTPLKIVMPRLYKKGDSNAKCQVPFTSLAIDPEGNATPCPVRMFTEKLGNVKDDMNIWNSPFFQLRREIFSSNGKPLLDFCKTCPCLVAHYRTYTSWTSLTAKGLKLFRAFKII